MTTKNILKIIVSTGVCIILSIVLYKYIVAKYEHTEISPNIKNEFLSRSYYQLYFHCVTYFFTLTVLPFIISAVSMTSNFSKRNSLKKLLVFEIIVLLFIKLITPPDILIKIIMFGLWQIPIAVNLISILITIRKREKANSDESA